MISHEDIKNLVSEWHLREDIIEKDYVIGWVLWGIGSDPDISYKWFFKGGTCIKKCYIETYRFSEDLDFTVLPNGPIKLEELLPVLNRILKRVAEESGIDFSVATPRLKQRESPLSVEGRIYYRGPRNAPTP
ncbi:MAG: nucleotidyl transferase AbiEii/AbiGii toxin family protein, partial [candidate division WOR-3 bacterium]|nr:nucleotidyl transferase AbiEii/AbiGii toxin family protein [candidate division WOR-3 bacterium]